MKYLRGMAYSLVFSFGLLVGFLSSVYVLREIIDDRLLTLIDMQMEVAGKLMYVHYMVGVVNQEYYILVKAREYYNDTMKVPNIYLDVSAYNPYFNYFRDKYSLHTNP